MHVMSLVLMLSFFIIVRRRLLFIIRRIRLISLFCSPCASDLFAILRVRLCSSSFYYLILLPLTLLLLLSCSCASSSYPPRLPVVLFYDYFASRTCMRTSIRTHPRTPKAHTCTFLLVTQVELTAGPSFHSL